MKFLAFLAQWITFAAAAFLTVFYIGTETASIALVIVAVLLFLLSGVCRRVLHIKKEDVEKYGWGKCIVNVVACYRLYFSIVTYLGVAIISVALHGIVASGELYNIIVAVVGLIVFWVGKTFAGVTCAHCGARLILDGENYDNHVTIKHTSTESTATQMSTRYYHCSVCGRRSRKRIKNTVGKVTYN